MRRHWKVICLILSCFPLLACALPTNPHIIYGGIALQNDRNTLHIEAANGSIVEWGDFSIGRDEIVNIDLPDASSCIYCKVRPGHIMRIEGTLISKGRILLIDPDGFYIDPMASICCAEIVLSTSECSKEHISPMQSLGPVKVSGQKSLTDDGSVKFIYAINLSSGMVWLD